ncbi:hypothetical protein JKP88DRAFT_317093, partial [Tribonema minus]
MDHSADGEEGPYIVVPVSNQAFDDVHIPIKSLPGLDIMELYDVLKVAVEYYRQDCKESFRQILREIIGALNPQTEKYYANDPEAFKIIGALSPQIEKYYANDPEELKTGRLKILNALASDAVKRASAATDTKQKDEFYNQALEYLAGADRIDPMSELTWVGKGIFYLSQGELDRAKYFFENARKSRKNLAATLGEACICFQEGRYKAALDHYCEVIRTNPACGASVRVGLGLCCYKLGQVARARAALQRALEMDPRNADALVGLAILELNEGGDQDSEQARRRAESAIKMLSRAFILDRDNAMVLNHLANHYFWTWMLVKTTVSVQAGGHLVVCKDDVSVRADLTDPLRPDGAPDTFFHPGDYIRIGGGPPLQASTPLHVDPTRQSDGTRIFLTDPYPGPTAEGLSLHHKNYDKVKRLAERARAVAKVPDMKAESAYLLARVAHVHAGRADATSAVSQAAAAAHLKDARALYAEAAKLAPQFAPAQYGLAQDAGALYAEAAKLAPQFAPAQYGLAQSTGAQDQGAGLGLGGLKDARALYAEAAKLAPQFAPAQYGLAKMLVREGQTDEAIACLKLVLEQAPDNQESLLLLGLLYARKDQRKPALLKFKQALELSPNLREAWIAQAQASDRVFQQDPAEYNSALASYLKALAVGDAPTSSGGAADAGVLRGAGVLEAVWTNIAVLQENLGKLPEAMAAYEKALDLGSQDARASDEDFAAPNVRAFDPANKLFWTWKALAATAKSVSGRNRRWRRRPRCVNFTTDFNCICVPITEDSMSVCAFDPANKLFWTWNALAATAKAQAGNPVVMVSEGVSLAAGDHVRIGAGFVTEVKDIISDTEFEMSSDLEVAGLGTELTGPLYKK